MQKLWAVSDTAGIDGAKRKTETKCGDKGRRAGKAEERIPEMVAQQEEIDG
jgi:hypothetical protein